MARNFNGSSDVVDCSGGSGSLNIPTNGTLAMSCWASMATLPTSGNEVDLVIKGFDGSTTAYALSLNNVAGTQQIRAYAFVSSTVHGAIFATTLTLNTWAHLYGDYDGSNWHVYVNGALGNTTADANGPQSNAVRFSIGAAFTGSFSNFAKGNIADAAVWNINLTQQEITSLSQGARPYKIRPTALKGYWPLDGIASPEPDLSGFTHNGALTGTLLAFGPPLMQFTPRTPIYIPFGAGQLFQPAWAIRNRIVVEGIGI